MRSGCSHSGTALWIRDMTSRSDMEVRGESKQIHKSICLIQHSSMIDVSILPDTHVHVQGCTGQIAATRREGNAGDRLAVVAKHGALAQGVSTLEDTNKAVV